MNRRFMSRLVVAMMALILVSAPTGVAAQRNGPPPVLPPWPADRGDVLPVPPLPGGPDAGYAGPRPVPPRAAVREAPVRSLIVLSESDTASGTNGIEQNQIAIPAIADSYIASGRPDENFGSSGLYLGYNLATSGYAAERILIQFDVQGTIPVNVTITDASLRLYMDVAVPTNDAPMGTLLRRLNSSWSESTVTWNFEPSWGPTETIQYVGSTPGFYEWPITSLVQAWYDGTTPNYGMEIIGDERVQERERIFYSRETTTPDYPVLLVTYTHNTDILPPVVTIDALPTYEPRTFIVSWSGNDQGTPPSGIAYYDVQYAVNGGAWIDWILHTTATSASYTGANDDFVEFRARGVDNAGNIETYGNAQAHTTVDTVPPVTTIDPLPAITSATSFVVAWSGSDNLSGIATYDVIYRANNGMWVPLLTGTTESSTIFNVTTDAFPGIVDGVYSFDVRATDNVGNQEPFGYTDEASIIVDSEAPFVVPQRWMPLIFKGGMP